MGDGHLNKCKDCAKLDEHNRGILNRNNPDYVFKERERGREKYKRLYVGSKPKPEVKSKANGNYKVNYPEKIAVRNKCSHLRPIIAGNSLHHWSYGLSHAKSVLEISKENHYLAHRHLIYDQEHYLYRTIQNELLDTKEKHIDYLISLGIEIHNL